MENRSSTRAWPGRLKVALLVVVSFWALALLDIAALLSGPAALTGSTLLLLLGVCSFWALLGGAIALAAEYLWGFSAGLSLCVRVAALAVVLALVPLALLGSLAATGLPSLAGAVRWTFLLGIAAATLFACGLAAWLALRRGGLRGDRFLSLPSGLLLVAVAFSAFVADATVLVRLYPELHYGLAYVALLSLIASLSYTRRLSRPFEFPSVATGIALATLTLALVASAMQFSASDYLVLFEKSTWSRKLASLSRSAVDLDGDGHSLILGGGDCQDRNPLVNPGSIDIPENGVDDDCTDGDLTLEKILAVGRPMSAPLAGAAAARPSHIFLFTVDTLRADHLGAYGYERNTSPHLNDMAQDAVVFERAFSQGNNTATSFPSLMTGRYPSGSPWSFEPAEQHSRGWPFLHDENNLTLPEVLRAAGFRTAAIMRGAVALATGLDQGLERKVLDPADPVSAFSQVLDESRGVPLFAWIHLDHPHDPYVPRALPFGSSPMDAYDAEILDADRIIGGALDEIRRRGLWETSLVAITSDHGEEFGEHGGRFHASTLYNEQIHVPLIVRFPQYPSQRVTRNVQLVDLMPTIAESVGQALSSVDGRSLLSHIPFDESVAYSEQYDGSLRRRALIQGRHKLIQRIRTNTFELYDLSADPGETKNLIDSQPEVGQRLRIAMDAIANRRALLLVALAARADRQGMERLAENVHQIPQPLLRGHAMELVLREIRRGTMAVATLSKMAAQPAIPEVLRDAAADAIELLGPSAREELARLARARGTSAGLLKDKARQELPQDERAPAGASGTLLVEFDGSRSAATLQGFGGPERLGARTVQWGSERRSRLVFEHSGNPRQLSLTLEGRAIAAARSAIEVRVSCNGTPVGALSIPKTWTVRGVIIPARAVRAGENVLDLTYSETVEPAKINAASKDPRHLSVLYDWLILAPITDRAAVDLRSAAPGVAGLSGFYDTEGSGDGAFRWSRDRRSEIELFLDPDEKRDYELVLDARAFHPIAPVGVRVSVNGTRLGRVDVSEQNQQPRLMIPGARLSPIVRILLEYDRTAKPADVLPPSRDTRDIALRWSGLRLTPLGDDVEKTTRESSVRLPAEP